MYLDQAFCASIALTMSRSVQGSGDLIIVDFYRRFWSTVLRLPGVFGPEGHREDSFQYFGIFFQIGEYLEIFVVVVYRYHTDIYIM